MSLEQWFGRGRGRGQGCCGNGQRKGRRRGRQRWNEALQNHQVGLLQHKPEVLSGTAQVRPESLQNRDHMIAMVDETKCIGCGLCSDACVEKAISVNGIATIDPDICIGCGVCIPACPNESLWLAHASIS